MWSWGILEVHFFIEFTWVYGVFIGDQGFKRLGHDYAQSHCGLEVGLVEHCENSVCVVGLELGVYVLFGVYVREAYTTVAIVVVFVSIWKCQCVCADFQMLNGQR